MTEPEDALPWLGTMWTAALPRPERLELRGQFDPGEGLLGAQEGAAARPGHERVTLVVGARRAWIVVTDTDGHAHSKVIDEPLQIERARLGRDRILMGGAHVLSGPLVGGDALRQLAALTELPPPERALEAARAYHEAQRWAELAELAARAEALAEEEADALARAPAPPKEESDVVNLEAPEVSGTARLRAQAERALSPTERAILYRARAHVGLGEHERAVSHLARLSKLRPEDDLIDSTAEVGQYDEISWWILLALAHEEASSARGAAAVYGHLAAHAEGGALFELPRARALRRIGSTAQACQAYDRFLQVRLASEDFRLLTPSPERAQAPSPGAQERGLEPAEHERAGADPEVVAACLELGELREARAEWLEAARAYLMLIRQAPFLERSYERLFALRRRLTQEPHAEALLGQIAVVLRLLDPKRAAQIEGLPPAPAPAPIPPEFAEPLGQERHDEQLVHPGEQATRSLAQRWVGSLLAEEEDTADIERHCQPVLPRTHPELAETLARIASFVERPTPRCYLSHGMTGARVLGGESDPLILMGAAHLDPEHGQYLSPRQRAFALGTQLEHIRAGHLVLTSSEFWGAFRDRALTGAVALLSLVPLGGALGKLADSWAGGLLGKLRERVDSQTVRKLIELGQSQLEGGAAHDGIQSAYEATLSQLVVLTGWRGVRTERDEASLLKEQLADFARCAMYTADRLGLLACDDLGAAVRAILLLSARTAPEIGALESGGLGSLLARRGPDGELACQELALRLGELFKFATSTEYLALRELHAQALAPEEEQ